MQTFDYLIILIKSLKYFLNDLIMIPVGDYTLGEWLYAIFLFVIVIPLVPGIIAYLIFKTIGISGFRRLFSFSKVDSPMHRLNPITKILYVLMIGVSVAILEENIFIGDIEIRMEYIMLALFFSTFIGWKYANPSSQKLRAMTIIILTQWLVIAWGQSFLNPGFSTNPRYPAVFIFPRPLWLLGIQRITVDGFRYGFVQGIRVAAALSAALLLITTTHPSYIIYALRKFKIPLEINFMVSITFKSIPTILEKSFLVLSAERARGLNIRPERTYNIPKAIKSAQRQLKNIVYATFPIIIESVRAARQMAVAANVRAFRAEKTRTYYKEIPMSTKDKILSLIFVAIMVILFILTQPPGVIPFL